MNGKYLLDTNTISALFANEQVVKEKLGDASEVFVPSIAVGQLSFGARKSEHVKDNLGRIDGFVANNTVLEGASKTARSLERRRVP